MEEEWLIDRARLRDLLTEDQQYPRRELAQRLGRSLGWVKKWIRRLHDAPQGDLTILQRRAHPVRIQSMSAYDPRVISRILELRSSLADELHRTPGPKPILYHLAQDNSLHGLVLPRSTRTIWKILHLHHCIPLKVLQPHQPFDQPAPLQSWQIDFKSVSSVPPNPDGKQQHVVEVLNMVDVGTSILVDSQPHSDFNAATVILALIQTFIRQGMPSMITCDRDPRFVGSWSGQDFPSAFVRFLHCLGVKPHILPPHRPDQNAFVERFHRTLNQECLRVHRPATLEETLACTDAFRWYYNSRRPHQGRNCGNRPPYEAFPTLPKLPDLPNEVDPDHWLNEVDGHLYSRRVDRNGSILMDNRRYYVSQKLRGCHLVVRVDAAQRQFIVLLDGQPIKRMNIKGLHGELITLGQYLKIICEEAHSQWQRWKLSRRKRRRVYELE